MARSRPAKQTNLFLEDLRILMRTSPPFSVAFASKRPWADTIFAITVLTKRGFACHVARKRSMCLLIECHSSEYNIFKVCVCVLFLSSWFGLV